MTETQTSDEAKLRLQPSPGEVERLLEEERARRRVQRIKQVRQRASKMSQDVLSKVADERKKQVKKITLDQLQKYREAKTVELALLEEQYQQCLNDIGIGHKGVREAEEFTSWLEKQCELENFRARARGAEAMRRQKRQRELEAKLKENKLEVRKSAVAREKLRSAEQRKALLDRQKCQLVEVDPSKGQKVKFVKRKNLIESPSIGEQVSIRRIPLSDVGNSGLEAAILEQEEERRKNLEAKEADRRRRLLEEKQAFVASTPSPAPSIKSEEDRLLSTIIEEDEESRQMSSIRSRENDQSEVDFVPVRGPSRLRETIQDPMAPIPKPSAMPSVDNLSEKDLDSIRTLLERVHSQEQELNQGTKRMVSTGQADGAKNNEADRDFIARVLGVRAQDVSVDKQETVQVRVNVEEASTLRQSESSGDSSSNSIARERFTSRQFTSEYSTIHGLINVLRSSSSSSSSASTPESQKEKSLLRFYIEKLLQMKREEVAQLSVTESSVLSPSSSHSPLSNVSSKGLSSATPVSILTNSQSRSTSSSSSSGGSKTVRFKDEHDGSFLHDQMNKEISLKELEERKAEIERKTEQSLERIRSTFESQRAEIEEKLRVRYEKKMKQSIESKITMTPSLSSSSSTTLSISEGLLSETSSSSHHEGRDKNHENKESPTLESPTSLSSSSSDHKDISEVLESLKLNWAHSMLRRMQDSGAFAANKSSSSGSSGSAAIAELHAKLSKIEVPRLEKPQGQYVQSSRSEDDTLARVTEIQSSVGASAAEASSIHLTSSECPGIIEQSEISLVSADIESDGSEREAKY